MPDIPAPAKQPVLVSCRPCGHVWAAAYLPMDAVKMARLVLSARCPNCGARGKALFMASEAQAAVFEHYAAAVRAAGGGR